MKYLLITREKIDIYIGTEVVASVILALNFRKKEDRRVEIRGVGAFTRRLNVGCKLHELFYFCDVRPRRAVVG